MTKTKDSKPLIFLRKQIEKDLSVLPDCIDNKQLLHKMVFKAYQQMFILLSRLTDKSFLSDRTIRVISDSVQFNLDVIDSSIEFDITVQLHSIFTDRIEVYKRYCIHNELYECAQNFEKFEKYYSEN